MAPSRGNAGVQVRLERRRQLRDAFISPSKLTLFYCAYLIGIILIHFVYGAFHCSDPSAGCRADRDWFRAAILDNYAFLAIVVYPLLIAYLQLTQDLDIRFRDMVTVLAGRGVLRTARNGAGESALVPLRPTASEAVQELDRIELGAVRLGEQTGTLVMLAIAVALGAVGVTVGRNSAAPAWYLAALAALHAPIALPIVHTIGARLMRAVYYGAAVYRHRKHGVVPVPLIEHSDRAGGLKPLGDYVLGQAYRMCLISGFVIVATLFLLVKDPIAYRMLGSGEQNAVHQTLVWVFIGCSAFVLVMQLLAVVVPLWTVHLRMMERKREMLGRAAIMTRRRQRLLARLSSPRPASGSLERDGARLEAVERWIGNFEAFPTWPIPRGDLRSFWVMWGGSISAAFAMLATALFGEGADP